MKNTAKEVGAALSKMGGSLGIGSGGGGGGVNEGEGKTSTGAKVVIHTELDDSAFEELDELTEELEEEEVTIQVGFKEKVGSTLEGLSGKVLEFAEKFTVAFQGAFDVAAQALENQSLELDNYYEKEQQKINQSKMSEEQKQAALLALDEKVAKKRKEIARKQAIADKAMAVFNAIVQTAVNVTKVIANPIMAGIVAALGAAQVGLIMGQPIPALASGGPLAGGQPALVGEMGPEIFKPNTSGTIIPNHALGGGGNISGQFILRGSDLVAAINNELINEDGPNAKTITG